MRIKDEYIHHVLLLGDTTEALRWLPWAKSQMYSLERYHPLFDGESTGIKKYRTLRSRGFAVILLKKINWQKWIIIWADTAPNLYMESGFLDLINIAPLNENTYLPAQLYYNDTINSIRGDGAELGDLRVVEIEDNKLTGENMDPGESRALGCAEGDKEEEIVISDGETTRVFTSETPIYCPELVLFKRYQNILPPSMFSGKLRLMVQAIYGSKRRDYSVNLDFPSTSPVKLGNGGLLPWYTGNSCLFSGRNYEYFRVEIRSGKITAKLLIPSTAGKSLRRYLKKNSDNLPEDRKQRYEAYLLSTLDFAEENALEVDIGDSGELFNKGYPLAHGFSWNWDGSIGKAVTIRQKAGKTNVWQSTMHQISINEKANISTLEEGRLTVGTSIIEGPTDFTLRAGNDVIWYPDYFNGDMKPFISQSNALDIPTHVDADVPIYVLYDQQTDDFNVVRFCRETLPSGEGVLGGGHSSSTERSGPECGEFYCDYYSTSNEDLISAGFYVDSLFDGRAKEGDGITMSGNEASVDTGAVLNTQPSSATAIQNELRACGNNDPGITGGSAHFYSVYGAEATLSGFELRHQALLAIPFYNCDAVYLGRSPRIRNGTITAGHTTEGAKSIGAYTGKDNNGKVLVDEGRSSVIFENTPGFIGAQSIKTWNSQITGFWASLSDIESDLVETNIKYLANGQARDILSHHYAEDSAIIDTLEIPSCMSSALNIEDLQDWGGASGSEYGGGFDNYFSPVLFPTPSVPPGLFAWHSAVDDSYYITEEPGGSDFKNDGSYEGYSSLGTPPLISYVGFA